MPWIRAEPNQNFHHAKETLGRKAIDNNASTHPCRKSWDALRPAALLPAAGPISQKNSARHLRAPTEIQEIRAATAMLRRRELPYLSVPANYRKSPPAGWFAQQMAHLRMRVPVL